jgi:hypothetical protein
MDSNVAITLSQSHQAAAQLSVDELTALALQVATAAVLNTARCKRSSCHSSNIRVATHWQPMAALAWCPSWISTGNL